MLGAVKPDTVSRNRIAFDFLKAGIDRGETVIYVTSRNTSTVRNDMDNAWGGAATQLELIGQLRILSSKRLFPLEFQVENPLSIFKEAYSRALVSGRTGLRIACDPMVDRKEEYLERVLRFEEAYDTLKLGATTLCMYEHLDRYEFGLFCKLLLRHEGVIGDNLRLLGRPRRFLHPAIESALGDLLGETGMKSTLFHLAKVTGSTSTDEFMASINEDPSLLCSALIRLFGDPAHGICEMIRRKLAELTIDTL